MAGKTVNQRGGWVVAIPIPRRYNGSDTGLYDLLGADIIVTVSNSVSNINAACSNAATELNHILNKRFGR